MIKPKRLYSPNYLFSTVLGLGEVTKDWGEDCSVLAFWTSRMGREGLGIGRCGRSSARRRKYYGSRRWKFGREDAYMNLGERLAWISMEKKKVASKQMDAISRSTDLKSVEKMMFCLTFVRCNVQGAADGKSTRASTCKMKIGHPLE